jgi:cytochrome c peroxidase
MLCALLCAGNALAAGGDAKTLMSRAKQVFGTPPSEMASKTNPVTPAKIDLGRRLYYETKLSKSGEISCNSCHDLAAYGVDGEPTSPGHEGQRGGRNSPTVYHAAAHVAQFWDGRAADVEEQAKGPILNPIEMAMPSEAAVVKVLKSTPHYPSQFKAAFPGEADPVTYDNMARAIGAFERRLVTPAPFDDFLAGNEDALSKQQLEGLQTFMDIGCTACHVGPVIGGSLYQKMGLVRAYETEDMGRYEVTGHASDRKVFKVPSLRNIEKTGPYFHDGSIAELDQAIRLMGLHQLGRELSQQQVDAIAAFLSSLTGKIDTAYIAEAR